MPPDKSNPVAESQTPALLAIIARRLTPGNVFSVLQSESLAARRVAVEWLLRRDPDELTRTIASGLTAAQHGHWGILQALQHPQIELTESARRRLVELLRHPSETVRRWTVAVIVRKSAEDAERVLQHDECRRDPDCLRMLCQADNPALIVPLMREFGFPTRNPPPVIGLLAKPVWLADNHADHPREVEWLIREAGYCESPVTPDVLEMLSLGFCLVVPSMTPGGPADKWLERVRTFAWRLVSSSSETTIRDERSVDLQDPLDVALFLCAVRDADRVLFAAGQSGIPAELSRHQVQPAAVCFHGSARLVRRLFLTDAETLARELGIPANRQGEFVIDHARCALESIPAAGIAADRALRTEWQWKLTHPQPANSKPRPVASRNRPLTSSRSRPEFNPRQLVIGDFKPSPRVENLSPGARSVCHLAELANLDVDKLARRLVQLESAWRAQVVPIGIELQIAKVDPNQFGGWKEALPFLGIPSPPRPEFGGMLEAAFRPARSVHPFLLAPLLLHRLGAISATVSQEIACHISLQGDLNHQSRYLAFPQLFIHPSQRLQNLPESRLTRVMSKGLAHRNRDIEILSTAANGAAGKSDDPHGVRTELRVYRVFSEVTDGRTRIAPTYAEDLIATHLIGSAMLSNCGCCQGLAQDFCQNLRSTVTALSLELSQLLNGQFYESTGDSRDAVLMRQLPIFRAWSAARDWKRRHPVLDLDETFRTLRSRHLQELENHLKHDHGLELAWDEFQDLALFL